MNYINNNISKTWISIKDSPLCSQVIWYTFLQAGNLIYVLYARFKLNDKSLQNPVSRLHTAIPISQTPKAHKSTFSA